MNKRKIKPKALVFDYDDCIVKFLETVFQFYNYLNDTSVSTNDMSDWEFDSLLHKDARGNVVTGADIRDTFLEYEPHGLYAGLPPIRNAIKALEFCRKLGYKLIIITARKQEYEKDTLYNMWLNGVEYDEIYFEKDKAHRIKQLKRQYNIIAFADDKFSTVKEVADTCKLRYNFLVDMASNRMVEFDEEEEGINRISDLFEIIKYLKDVN